MEKSVFNYVRTQRQRHGLSTHELAFLLKRAPSYISQLEYSDGLPSLEIALALQVLFRQEPRHLFAGLYESVEDDIMRRAAQMLSALEGREDRRSVAKREFLESLPAPDNDDGV